MAFTIDQRKEEYFTYIVEESEKTYAAWKNKGTHSKRIAEKARKYAYSKRLQSDFFYRFRALIFLCALELRLEKRYAKFLKKLFLLFPFLRERASFRLLKRLLGYINETQMRDLISVELERLAMEISKLKDTETAGGGKTSFLDEASILSELQSFFELCVQAESQEMNPLDFLLEKLSVPSGEVQENVSQDGGVKREQISVEGLSKVQAEKAQGKETKQEKMLEDGKQKREDVKQGEEEVKAPEKKAEKITQSTAIPSEIAAAFPKETQEENTPFPIFREEKIKENSLENKGVQDGGKPKDTPETKDVVEILEKGVRSENEKGKVPFPIFKGREEVLAWKTENPAGKVEKENSSETSVREKMFISDENKIRIALRDSLSDAEKRAIAMHLQEMAALYASVEEQKWLEENADRVGQVNNRISQAPPKNGFFLHNPKK